MRVTAKAVLHFDGIGYERLCVAKPLFSRRCHVVGAGRKFKFEVSVRIGEHGIFGPRPHTFRDYFVIRDGRRIQCVHGRPYPNDTPVENAFIGQPCQVSQGCNVILGLAHSGSL